MKQVRLGDVPLEFFTGVGDLRSHDKTGNKLSGAATCVKGITFEQENCTS